MNRRCILSIAAIVAGSVLAACTGNVPATGQRLDANGVSLMHADVRPPGRRVCAEPNPYRSECGVIMNAAGVRPDRAGWGPADLQEAYNLPSSSKGSGQIVAVVDAYDNPNVASDLSVYRSYFKLPPAKFKKFNQQGQQKNYPKGDVTWGYEIDLDVQMVSAVCPSCTIYLVEANDDNDLGAAEDEAVKLGAHIISNSWSWGSISESDFESPGVVYVASAGDSSYGSGVPAEYPNVVSVGGTILAKHGSRFEEIVWPFTGGGCAVGVTKPSWQQDPSCASRTQNDVSAVARDVAEYDSYQWRGWFTDSGTSVSTPIIAAIYGLAGDASSEDAGKKLWTLTPQEHKQFLHTIDKGSNGYCHGTYLCSAGTGQFGTYSGPAGWGTPNGIGAF
jgi:subtilase family serine protease